jgi:hypothetical protein
MKIKMDQLIVFTGSVGESNWGGNLLFVTETMKNVMGALEMKESDR